ncbi:PH domain-containing protein [Balneolaceae bacterium YR4-1]|uniref:PH domain-containing protein n=1 Tax=Halalkalibaculum roseum TaxID=2709311 RepID=A0A6M1T4K5_9BACT|nr:PH domain-containing protein [Halalkalibaculum roseum]NGP76925.1 PH domain-containing protein [Halalkalibaculum roseum]
MTKSSEKKSYTLTPSWKHYLSGYLLSILAVPLAGIGLIGLYFVRKRHKSTRYIITDTQISSIDSKYQRNVDLVNIENIELEEGWWKRKLGIGNLILHTSASELNITGIENPRELKDLLEKAISAEIRKQQEEEKNKPKEPKYSPGSMDKMEYLTGLWQQGLISEDDYENERKHFE